MHNINQHPRSDDPAQPPSMLGHVVALWDDGVGHIQGSDGQTYRFDHSQCIDPPFENLALQRTVRFLPTRGVEGREAQRVWAPGPR